MTGPTHADLIRGALRDPCTPRRTRDGWLELIDLQLRTGLDARQVDAALRAIDDEVEHSHGRPWRVRLTPAPAARQLTIEGGPVS